MKKTCLWLSLFCHACLGQTELTEISGYFQNDFIYAKSHAAEYSLMLNKFRMDFAKDMNENCTFEANLNYYHYDGKTRCQMGDLLPSRFGPSLGNMEMEFSNKVEIHNLYTRISLGKMDFLVGKQQISLGTGYAMNPSDIFNRKDLTDPAYEQNGIGALRADFNIDYSNMVSFILSPQGELNETKYMALFKTALSGFDLSFSYAGYRRAVDYRITEKSFEEVRAKTSQAGFCAAGQIWKPGVWLEGASRWLEGCNDHYEFILGMDYTFDSELYVMMEWFHKSNGKDNSEDYELKDWLLYYDGNTLGFNKNQLITRISYPLTDLFTLSQNAIVSLNDESVLLVPELAYSLFLNVDLFLRGIFYAGGDNDYFSNELGRSVMFRLTLYY